MEGNHMLARLRSRAQEEKGFTLIELLVVVLIIGILAAIAIPAFLGQKKGAQDSNAKSVLRNAAIALESYYSENQDFGAVGPVAVTSAEMDAIEPNLVWTTGVAAPAFTATTVDAKEDEVFVHATGGTATVAPTGYTLYSKSASNNGFAYVRASDASVARCKDTSGSAFDVACGTNEW
jgi:type IV pilus assembly protein PilA